MKKRTHFYIARLSVERNRPAGAAGQEALKEWAFYLGAILPDLSVFQFIHPHYYDKSAGYVFHKLNKIACRPTRSVRDAIRLGELVHYLCDFCCYAHIGGKIGCVSEHCRYERGIQQFVIDHYQYLGRRFDDGFRRGQTPEGIMEQIKKELADYYSRVPGYQLDIMKSINITSIVYYGLLYNHDAGRNTGLALKLPAVKAEVLP